MIDSFKFRSINKNLIDSLVRKYLYFSEPQDLNDPFDCQVDLSRSIGNLNSLTSGNANIFTKKLAEDSHLMQIVEIKIQSTGILSLSTEQNNPLMWSHYADEHRGVCLYYQFPDSFINYQRNNIIGSAPVKYSEDIEWDQLIKILDGNNNIDIGDVLVEITKPMLTYKGNEWSYEKEFRIIRENPGKLPIAENYLKQVCFGLKTSNDDRELIQSILSNNNYNVSYSEIVRTSNDFGIETKDL